MRNTLQIVLKEELRHLAIVTRDRLGLTQREMAKLFEISESSYSDIETGKSICGSLTTVLLLGLQPNPGTFIQQAIKSFSKEYGKDMQSL